MKQLAVDMKKVDSSTINSIGYYEDKNAMYVQFKNDSLYCYDDVDVKVFEEFKNAESKGKYFHSIKNDYKCRKI
jgi:hypothetical protein